MKNKKFGVFALLGVLSISGIAIGIATGEGNLLSNVEANETGSCALTWNKSNAPELGGQAKVTDTASTVTLNYDKVLQSPTGHIRLKDGGSVATANVPYNDLTGIGGYCNGMTSITVNFKENGPSGIGCVQQLDLNITFGNVVSHKYSTTNDESTKLVSGQKITFADAPRSFNLKYTGYDEMEYGYGVRRNAAAATYSCDIESIVVECTMEATYTGKLTTAYGISASASDFSVYKADNLMEARLAKISDLSKERLTYGQILAFAPNENYNKTIAAEDLLITGGEIVKTTILTGNKQPTFFINVTGDLQIKVNSVRNMSLYEGEAFVGTYDIYKLKDGTTTKVNLSADGKFKFGDKTAIDYEYKNGKFTISNYKIKLLGNVIHLVDNQDSYSRFVGVLNKGTNVNFVKEAGSNNHQLLRVSDKNGSIARIYVKTDYIVVNGYNDAIIENVSNKLVESLTPYNGDVLRVSAPIVNGKSALDDFAPIDGKTTVGNTDYLQLTINKQTSDIKPIFRETAHGTYKSADQSITLVYDGYGYATINGGEPKVATIKNKVLTVEGDEYKLDPNSKTVVKLLKDPLKTTGKLTYSATINGSTKSFIFTNGKVSTNLNDLSSVSYTFNSNYLYTVRFEIGSDPYSWGTDQYYTYELQLSEDHTTLTVVKDVYLRWIDGDSTIGGLHLAANTVFTLVQ